MNLRILFNTITVPVLRPIPYETERTLGLFITLSPSRSFPSEEKATGILHVAIQIGLYLIFPRTFCPRADSGM